MKVKYENRLPTVVLNHKNKTKISKIKHSYMSPKQVEDKVPI